MADTEMKKAQEVEQAAGQQQEGAAKKDVTSLLSAFGGFNAVRGFLPDADNLNPTRKAAKQVFLTDKRFKDKREALKKDLKGWLALLEEDHGSATEFTDACKAKEGEIYRSVETRYNRRSVCNKRSGALIQRVGLIL